jgi:hypothetical protein
MVFDLPNFSDMTLQDSEARDGADHELNFLAQLLPDSIAAVFENVNEKLTFQRTLAPLTGRISLLKKRVNVME